VSDAFWIFWVPLLLLFVSTGIGAIVKNRSRDACLKRFDHCYVVIRTEDNRWFWGLLRVFSTCLELGFETPTLRHGHYLKRSYVFYEPEIQTIVSVFRLIRKAESSEEEQQWQRELQTLMHRSPWKRLLRQGRNLLNILRDAFSQSIGLVVGLAKTRQRFAALPTLDQRSSEFGRHLLSVVSNAYEPILERYRGQTVVVESTKPGLLPEQVAVFEEYTERFILLRDGPAPADIPPQALPVSSTAAWHFDAVHARRLITVRHLAERVGSLAELLPTPIPAGPLEPSLDEPNAVGPVPAANLAPGLPAGAGASMVKGGHPPTASVGLAPSTLPAPRPPAPPGKQPEAART
jgi:hypothetical protein